MIIDANAAVISFFIKPFRFAVLILSKNRSVVNMRSFLNVARFYRCGFFVVGGIGQVLGRVVYLLRFRILVESGL